MEDLIDSYIILAERRKIPGDAKRILKTLSFSMQNQVRLLDELWEEVGRDRNTVIDNKVKVAKFFDKLGKITKPFFRAIMALSKKSHWNNKVFRPFTQAVKKVSAADKLDPEASQEEFNEFKRVILTYVKEIREDLKVYIEQIEASLAEDNLEKATNFILDLEKNLTHMLTIYDKINDGLENIRKFLSYLLEDNNFDSEKVDQDIKAEVLKEDILKITNIIKKETTKSEIEISKEINELVKKNLSQFSAKDGIEKTREKLSNLVQEHLDELIKEN